MNYEETLHFLYEQLPMFQRQGRTAFKKDLTNIRVLCAQLREPQESFPSIHIAGTNGKGSTAHLLSAILQAQGYKVGLYTSPHYRDFRERIRVNGKLMEEDAVVEFVEEQRPAIDKAQPSFFEITVAMAFWYFREQNVDIAVIETGLGGRLDSTNILFPQLSIITNIGFDHQDFLGETLQEIAGEKAGIIKPETPVVIGKTHYRTRWVFLDRARDLKAPIRYADVHYDAALQSSEAGCNHYKVWYNDECIYEDLEVGLLGPYQYENIQTVLQSVKSLRSLGFKIKEKALLKGLRDVVSLTGMLGRWQILQEKPLCITDAAHNEDGLRTVMQQLDSMPKKQLHIVLGVVKEKRLGHLLALFPQDAQYYLCTPDVPRGLPTPALRQAMDRQGFQSQSYDSVAAAYQAALEAADEEDLVFVGGSTFVVAEVV